MTKVEREVVFNSENGQKEMTGVRLIIKSIIYCIYFIVGLISLVENKQLLKPIFQKNMLKRIRIVRVRPWGVCTGVISTVGVLYQIGQLSLIFSLV